MKKGTIYCAVAFVIFFLIALAALIFLAPWLVRLYIAFRNMPHSLYAVILTTFYCCTPPAAVALFSLLALLRAIQAGEYFIRHSSFLLNLISWCCVTVAIFTFAAGFWYMPFCLIAGAMMFIFLIVRIVALCFSAATALKEENNLTI